MRHFSLIFGVFLVGAVLLPRLAAADIAPEGACQLGEIGEACDHAVDESGNVVGSGVCAAEKCTRASPSGSLTYDCAMCRPAHSDPGAGGTGGGDGSPAGASQTAGTTSKPTEKPESSDDGGGCSLTSSGHGTGLAAFGSFLVLGLALVRRRASNQPA